MFHSPFLTHLIVIAVLLGAGLTFAMPATKPLNGKAVAAAVLHPLTSLCLFYSLAIHMHSSLGGWPGNIGRSGLPGDVLRHEGFTSFAFGSLLIGCMFAWPIAFILCSVTEKMRPGLRYLGIYALASGVAFLAMEFAPAPYLEWWWD